MQPGRELDTLVAEKVMGWERITDGALIWWEKGVKRGHPDSYFNSFPCYSTDISAAWEVLEKLREERSRDSHTDEVRGLDIYLDSNEVWLRDQHWNVWEVAKGKSVPHAICLAALQLVGVTF